MQKAAELESATWGWGLQYSIIVRPAEVGTRYMDIFGPGAGFQQVAKLETSMAKKKGEESLVWKSRRKEFRKSLQSPEHRIDILWFTFLKEYCGYCVEKRLKEDKAKAGRQVRRLLKRSRWKMVMAQMKMSVEMLRSFWILGIY